MRPYKSVPWQKLIDPYVKSGFAKAPRDAGLSIWYCLDFDSTNNSVGAPPPVQNGKGGGTRRNQPDRSYVLNWWVAGYAGADRKGQLVPAKDIWRYRQPIGVSKVVTSAQTVLAAETRGGGFSVTGNDTGVYNDTTYPGCSNRRRCGRLS